MSTPTAAADRRPALQLMRWPDIAAVAELEQLLFPTDSPWTAEMFWAELAAGHHYLVHRTADGTVVGYAGLAANTDDAGIQTIGVQPGLQGRGLGRALLAALLVAAGDRRVVLEVRTDNEAAIGLYQSSGFRRIGLRRKYYQPSGADALTMERPAPGEQR